MNLRKQFMTVAFAMIGAGSAIAQSSTTEREVVCFSNLALVNKFTPTAMSVEERKQAQRYFGERALKKEAPEVFKAKMLDRMVEIHQELDYYEDIDFRAFVNKRSSNEIIAKDCLREYQRALK